MTQHQPPKDPAASLAAPLPVVAAVASRSEHDDTITLDYDARFVRRKRLVTDAGRAILIDLPQARALADGDVLVLPDGFGIAVRAAPEPLLEVRGDLPRLAWHIGNRHTPCRIEEGRLLIRADTVLADMLARLGAQIAPIEAPFVPEGGAYGHGRTFGHAHGPGDHDSDDHHDHHDH